MAVFRPDLNLIFDVIIACPMFNTTERTGFWRYSLEKGLEIDVAHSLFVQET